MDLTILPQQSQKKVFFPDLPWSEMEPCGSAHIRASIQLQSPLQSEPASVLLFSCVSQQRATHGILNWPSDDTRLVGDPVRHPEQLGWNVTNAAADVRSRPLRSISITPPNCHKWDGWLFHGDTWVVTLLPRRLLMSTCSDLRLLCHLIILMASVCFWYVSYIYALRVISDLIGRVSCFFSPQLVWTQITSRLHLSVSGSFWHFGMCNAPQIIRSCILIFVGLESEDFIWEEMN